MDISSPTPIATRKNPKFFNFCNNSLKLPSILNLETVSSDDNNVALVATMELNKGLIALCKCNSLWIVVSSRSHSPTLIFAFIPVNSIVIWDP